MKKLLLIPLLFLVVLGSFTTAYAVHPLPENGLPFNHPNVSYCYDVERLDALTLDGNDFASTEIINPI